MCCFGHWNEGIELLHITTSNLKSSSSEPLEIWRDRMEKGTITSIMQKERRDSRSGTWAGLPWTGGPRCPCCRGWWRRSAGKVRKTSRVLHRPEKFNCSFLLLWSDACPQTAATRPCSYSSTRRSLFRGLSTTATTCVILPTLSEANPRTPSLRWHAMCSRRATQTRYARTLEFNCTFMTSKFGTLSWLTEKCA